MNSAIAVVLAYLLGSIPFAILMSRAFNLKDPRTYGSRNPGATNVLRSGNKLAAGLTLALDGLKGFAAVWACSEFGPRFGIEDDGLALVAVAVFLGHLYPVFFGFKGGKGVATACGVLFGLQWWLGLFTLATWLIIAFFFRFSSLAALVAAVFAPFFYVLILGPDIIAVAILVIAVFVVYRHRVNIANLLAGREGKIGAK
ncbi:MAG: glycerol-3-phosphate 1-O-acyltransferase PlsY [Burkholderiaceae bacterium]